MTTALLVLLLVSGTGTAFVVDRDLCIKTADAVRNGDRVTLEDDKGVLHEVEIAKCLIEPESLKVETPLS